MMTAGGTGVILQKYDNFDPSMMKEMMLSELTKESVNYGYKLVREDYKRKLDSGQEVNVLRAVLEYKGEYEYYEVSTSSKKDEGILIATMITVDEFDDGGKEMIELFWKTLNIL
jgi:predicted PolB exonuclease-like 3'-5' exonuclease